jgi:HEAT repeat protein
MMADAPNLGEGRRKLWVGLIAVAGIATGIGLYVYQSPYAEGARGAVVRIARALRRIAGKDDKASKPIAAVIHEIEHGDEVQKAQTIVGLRYELTEPAELAQVFPHLIRAAKDESTMVRDAAISALGPVVTRLARDKPGPNHREPAGNAPDSDIEESLAGLLDDPSPTLRASAAGFLRPVAAIRRLDVPPPKLVACLDDDSERVRAAAAESLIEYGQGPELFLPVALRRLPTEGPIAFGEFTRILWNIRFAPSALPLLIEGLSSDNALICVTCATVINHMGLDAKPARPAVMALLQKELENPHRWKDQKDYGAVDIIEQASEALVHTSPDGDLLPGTVEILCEVLKRPNLVRQQAAAWSLGILGRTAAPAVPLLIKAFDEFPNDPKNQRGDFDRGTIALALAEITKGTPDADRVIASLAKEWRTAPPALKPHLAKALRSLGSKSEKLVPELRQWPADNSPSRIQRGRSPRSFLE